MPVTDYTLAQSLTDHYDDTGTLVPGILRQNADGSVSITLAGAAPGTKMVGGAETVSAALAAITDASASKRYQILVTGKITETVEVALKSHVDIVSLVGAQITNANDDTTVTVRANGVTDVQVSGVTFIRSGALTGTNRAHCLVSQNATDDTVTWQNCQFLNTTTKGAGTTNAQYCHGIYVLGGGGRFTNCYAAGGQGDQHSYGVTTDTTATAKFYSCAFSGGTNGIGCHGGSFEQQTTPEFYGCTFVGGGQPTDTVCYGIKTNDQAKPLLVGCRAKGGLGGTSHGILSDFASSPNCTACDFEGGDGGTSCTGADIISGSSARFSSCNFRGGVGGINCNPLNIQDSATGTFAGCNFSLRGLPGLLWPYASANNGRFQSVAAAPWTILSLRLNVKVTHAGWTVAIGSTIGGSDIASGISLTSAGYVQVSILAIPVLALGAYAYATVTGGTPATDDFELEVNGCYSYASCEAIYFRDHEGYFRAGGGMAISNPASDAVRLTAATITSIGLNPDAIRFDTMKIEALQAPSGAKSSVNTDAAPPAGIFWNCSFNGGFGGSGLIPAWGPPDAPLFRDAASKLGLHNGVTSTELDIYNTYTDPTHYESLRIFWTGNIASIETSQGGAGGTNRNLQIGTAGSGLLFFVQNNTAYWKVATGGHFITQTDNQVDIGASLATRPRDVYLAGKVKNYNALAVLGNGVPSIVAYGRPAQQVNTTVVLATYANPALDQSFEIQVNINVTVSTTVTMTVTCTYTDEAGVARTLTIPFLLAAGTLVQSITTAQGNIAYASLSIPIRVKASTTISLQTAGTVTAVTYTGEAFIRQTA